MSTNKKETTPTVSIFGKENYMWMLIGAGVIALGMFLMKGGKSEDPKQFLDNEVYGFVRMTVAPILILAGLVLEIFAIFRKPKEA
jgi:predicted histidine transporter YuiF (NhaC family)